MSKTNPGPFFRHYDALVVGFSSNFSSQLEQLNSSQKTVSHVTNQLITDRKGATQIPHGLQTGWLKCDKLHLAKNLGSLGWFVHGSLFDPIPLGSSIEGKSQWLLKALSTQHAVLSRNFFRA